MSGQYNVRNQRREVSEIYPDNFRIEHPDIAYNGAPEEYEDAADYLPRSIKATVIA